MLPQDKAYMERKQLDWEFDEPEASDYALFVQQLKGLIAWLIVMLGLAMIVAAVVVK
jgi:hypothetical protein